MRTKLLLQLIMSCCLVGALTLPTHAYNSPTGDSPDVSRGHPWITNKAIDYLKKIDPFAYAIANKYRQQIIYGSWFADHNSGDCHLFFAPLGIELPHFNCDSTNHYEPRFRFTTELRIGPIFDPTDRGTEGTVSAAEYAGDLFGTAVRCLPFRDLPEASLPQACATPQWRRVELINIEGIGDTPDFDSDGPLIRKSPFTLLGWALHMVQDQTQVYHTYSMPTNGHAEFETDVDTFILAGKGNNLPSRTTDAPIEVPTTEFPIPVGPVRLEDFPSLQGFVYTSLVAGETRDLGKAVLVDIGGLDRNVCCHIPDGKLGDEFIETSLNRAIIYSAKLIQYYVRNPAKQLSTAIFQAINN